MSAQSFAELREPAAPQAPDSRSAADLLHEVERLRVQLRDLVTHLDDTAASAPDAASPQAQSATAGTRDRLYIAEQVTHRLDWLRRDAWDLERLLQGETLSPLFHESLCEVIQALQRVAKKASPRAAEQSDAA